MEKKIKELYELAKPHMSQVQAEAVVKVMESGVLSHYGEKGWEKESEKVDELAKRLVKMVKNPDTNLQTVNKNGQTEQEKIIAEFCKFDGKLLTENVKMQARKLLSRLQYAILHKEIRKAGHGVRSRYGEEVMKIQEWLLDILESKAEGKKIEIAEIEHLRGISLRRYPIERKVVALSGLDGLDGLSSEFVTKMFERVKKMMIESTSQDYDVAKYARFGYVGKIPYSLAKGGTYGGGNVMLLGLQADPGKLPVYIGEKELEARGLKKKATAEDLLTITAFKFAVDKQGNKVTLEDAEQDKENTYIMTGVTAHDVLSLDDTNAKEVKPDWYKKYSDMYEAVDEDVYTEDGMFVCPLLDYIREKQKWICPILTNKYTKYAYFTQGGNHGKVVMPEKRQYNTEKGKMKKYAGEFYYSTLLHEMAHSTLLAGRGNVGDGEFGSKAYAFEECVAETTSFTMAGVLGFLKTPGEKKSGSYVKSWNLDKADQKKLLLCISKAADILTDTFEKVAKSKDYKAYLEAEIEAGRLKKVNAKKFRAR